MTATTKTKRRTFQPLLQIDGNYAYGFRCLSFTHRDKNSTSTATGVLGGNCLSHCTHTEECTRGVGGF